MFKHLLFKLTTAFCLLTLLFSCQEKDPFASFPEGFTPVEVGNKVANRLLDTPHMFYNGTIHYAEVCTWNGAVDFAHQTGNDALLQNLRDRFEPLFEAEKAYLPLKNHVDFNMFGSLPLELYAITGDERYKELGLPYADTQWLLPDSAPERQQRLMDKGYTWQTRLWIDDMYMITIVQSKAYKVTGNEEYIRRSAHEMVMYLDSLQRPNGLFYHAPHAPMYWGRGNGWMAAGMTELLKNLPETNPNYPRIMQGYLKMMDSLKAYQSENGMWRQLVDDETCWYETSCTGMFAYAMITGVKKGWLPEEYAEVARKAWIALVPYINESGDITEVCAGTGTENDRQFYHNRPRITGDYHGQAPVLWCVNALLSD
ncbi:glycoside hydrolase family 88 protein, partial [Parabacteroides sp. OttesenSCG-928-O15]|nr:glycoside hydrolase family 88 protein [Parabacteroides sp. OttesenSCG-928-O15]